MRGVTYRDELNDSYEATKKSQNAGAAMNTNTIPDLVTAPALKK